jgi:hypothetical protein
MLGNAWYDATTGIVLGYAATEYNNIAIDSCGLYGWYDNSDQLWFAQDFANQGTQLLASGGAINRVVVDDGVVYWTDQTAIGHVPAP